MKNTTVQFKSFNKQRGNMVLQAAMAIGISAIVALGAMKGYEYYQDAKVSNEVNELSSLKTRTVNYAQSLGGSFTSTNTALTNLAGLNFWSKKMISGSGASTAVSNQWGGIVTTAVGTAKNSGDAIDYTYTAYPNFACKAVGTQINDIAAKVTIGGTVVKANGSPIDPAALGTQCDAQGDNVTIVYTLAR